MRYGRFLLGIVLTLLLVGVVAGAALTAYNAGVAQGMVTSGKLVVPSGDGSVAPAAPFYPPFAFGRPFGYRPFGFGFGLFGCLVPLFFIFLVFGLLRLVFRPRWGYGWGGPGRRGWDPSQGDMPERVKEWHRKLHEAENQTPPPAAPNA